jgi:hypothetical protein
VLVLLIALPVLPGCRAGLEETSSFKTVFDHYRDRENIVAVSFPPGLAGIFLSGTDPGQAELKTLMQELSTFRMLSVEGGPDQTGLAEELRMTVTDFTARNAFQDLFRMQSGGEDIFIRILENDGTIREAILMLKSGESFYVIDLRGNISMDHFTKVVKGGYLEELTRSILSQIGQS